jgi:thiazole synthase
VLLNTAISRAIDPVCMATAFASATNAGRLGYLAGPMPVQDLAVASTSEIGKPFGGHASQFVSKETA